ncbi:hypothetical protein PF010_g12182 [Phytophthora fragariae]|uniref:Uncharacterized protein n=1 Tax=Phytophthora fragariae TaxID=53985 RepID=A0A6A3K5Z9_9STRA|nr:hypothetical protein PF011_g13603 [Phytophthora fragariae]KAE9107692.1 hypothetical protein PF010_g12182 [Phytophthora fragariae]
MRGPCACSSSSRLPARAGLALVVLPPLSCNGNTSTSTDSPGATPSSMRGPCACSSSSRLPARAGLALAVLLPPLVLRLEHLHHGRACTVVGWRGPAACST